MTEKRMKKFLSIAISFWVMISSNLSVVSMATEEDININPTDFIEISTVNDLINIENNLDGNYVLKNDIVLSGDEWRSIGGGLEFKGTFDGAGYTISNLYSERGRSLFSVLGESAVVKNLTISGNMVANTYSALLATTSYGTIINCTSSGSVRQFEYNGRANSLAGLVLDNYGYMEKCTNKAMLQHAGNGKSKEYSGGWLGGIAAAQKGTVISCVNEGEIISDCSESGGIAGYNSSFIIDCVNKGKVTAMYDRSNTTLSVGGITGVNDGIIARCLNQNSITSIAVNNAYATGGICGESIRESMIIDCKNIGTVSSSTGNIGGICGQTDINVGYFDENDEFIVNQGNIVISGCVNDGKIQGESNPNVYVNVAGIVARAWTLNGMIKVIDCTNNGNIEIIKK